MVLLADRRRVNGPLGLAADPNEYVLHKAIDSHSRPRTRLPGELRKLYLKTGLVPSVSGSAYLEVGSSQPNSIANRSGLKLTCTVHGPRPLPRSAPFSPHLVLSTRVKFAPFASRRRRGYIPDSIERDLASQLEGALRPVLLAERWPKSSLDIIVTVLEGEEDSNEELDALQNEWNTMTMLSNCVNVASAAIADAGIDCVDLLTLGVAAYIRSPDGQLATVLDPCLSDAEEIVGICTVGYLQSRDEISFLWLKDAVTSDSLEEGKRVQLEHLVDNASEAAKAIGSVCIDALASGSAIE